MRAYILKNTGLFSIQSIVIHFIENKRIIETQKSVNKRLKPTQNFGVAFSNETKNYNSPIYWSTETNEEISLRIANENSNLYKVEIN